MSDTVKRRPRGVMRERILDVALELFIEQGYDKTSLRDIAERLGVTKAAIYYHFERKEDILLQLHLRLHALGREALDELESLQTAEAQMAAWPRLIDGFIDQVIANREIFLVHVRNRSAFEQLGDDPRHLAEQDDLEDQVRRLLSNPDIPLAQRVRMTCALGAVVGALTSASNVFADVPDDELAKLMRDAVRDLTAPPRP